MSRSVRYLSDSVVGSGTLTTPSGASAIASIAAALLPAGAYEVAVYAGVSNNAVADLGNMELQIQSVDQTTPVPAGANGQMAAFVIPRITLDGAQNLTVEAIATGTTGIEYQATIVATKIEPR